MKISNFHSSVLILFLFMSCLLTIGKKNVFGQLKKPTETTSPKKVKTKTPAEAAKPTVSKQIGEINTQVRYALVIGNSKYPGMALVNPANDVFIIAKSLRLLNFNVTEKKDLTLSEMRSAVEDFGRQIPSNAIGLFFFAGHGLQVSGKNFLLPTDFKSVKTEQELLSTQLDLDSIIASISKKSGLTIIILDACRNNGVDLSLSFETEKGFAVSKQNAGGIYIAYSTSPGNTAYDGNDGNSPYTKSLAQNMLINPGRLEDIFIKTRIEVRNQTSGYPNGEQIPWENGSLSTLVYLTGDKSRKPVLISQPNSKINTVSIKPKLPFNIKNLLNFSFAVPRLDKRGSRIGLINKISSYFVENLGLSNMEMIAVSGGSFQMGTDFEEVETAYKDALESNDETDREVITAEMPKHSVTLSGFFMSKYEITQAQWQAVMGSLPDLPAEFGGYNKPVANITWKEAVKFCDILSSKTKRNYRLPTEAEWEYAARAGTETPFAFGENINSSYVNYFASVPYSEGLKGEYRQKPVDVGQLNAPNHFGLFDMHGNVSEWCADYWHWDYNGSPNDGSAWNEPAPQKDDDSDDPELYRVVRGGSFDSIGNNCRSARRKAQPAVDSFRASNIGFRVVATE